MPNYVYMLASHKVGTLYVGVTSDLVRRVYEHKNEFVPGFTKKYGIKQLVYYEVHEDFENALHREKCIKEWRRAWKIQLIEKENPNWDDLYPQIIH